MRIAIFGAALFFGGAIFAVPVVQSAEQRIKCTADEIEQDQHWSTKRCSGGWRIEAAAAGDDPKVDATWEPQSAAVREWRSAEMEVARLIEHAVRQRDLIGLQRLGVDARRLVRETPVELGDHGKIFCSYAANALADYALSVRQGKTTSDHADRQEWRRYQRDCDKFAVPPRSKARR